MIRCFRRSCLAHKNALAGAKLARSYRVRRNEAADHDTTAVMDVPHHGFANRVAAVADDGTLRDRHPLAFDRNPIGAFAKIIFSAMAIGNIAAGHAVWRNHTLEPGADVRGDVLVLPAVECETGPP